MRNGGKRSSCSPNNAGPINNSVFDSVACGEAHENSDVDLLVAWGPGWFKISRSRRGIKVHIGTEKSLNWYVRDTIRREVALL